MFFRRSREFPESDPQIYSDLVDTLLDEISASYDTYLDENVDYGLGHPTSMKVYDSYIGEIVSCDNTFVNFILANCEYLLKRMRLSMPDEAICLVLTNDMSYVCKSFVEKSLSTRPVLQKNPYDEIKWTRKSNRLRLRTITGVEGIFSAKDKSLLESIFLGLKAETFFKTFALDGDYFQIDANLKITFTPEVIDFWYPNGVEISKQSDVSKQSIYFWIACTLALQACLLNRHAFKELDSYMSQ